jgi:hypothetical protein
MMLDLSKTGIDESNSAPSMDVSLWKYRPAIFRFYEVSSNVWAIFTVLLESILNRKASEGLIHEIERKYECYFQLSTSMDPLN